MRKHFLSFFLFFYLFRALFARSRSLVVDVSAERKKKKQMFFSEKA